MGRWVSPGLAWASWRRSSSPLPAICNTALARSRRPRVSDYNMSRVARSKYSGRREFIVQERTYPEAAPWQSAGRAQSICVGFKRNSLSLLRTPRSAAMWNGVILNSGIGCMRCTMDVSISSLKLSLTLAGKVQRSETATSPLRHCNARRRTELRLGARCRSDQHRIHTL